VSAARILPREEWGRLNGEAAFYETLNPEDVAVVVVEDGGAIVARMAVLRVPHFESFWMAPEKIGNAGITRALLRAAKAKAAEWAPCWIMANAGDDAMCKTMERLGWKWLPIHTFMLSLRDEICRQQ